MKSRTLLLIILIVLLGVGSFAATRFVVNRNYESHLGCNCDELCSYLKLDNRQIQSVSGIVNNYITKRVELRYKLWQTRSELLELLNNPDTNDQEVMAALDRFRDAQYELQRNTISYILGIRKHLTSEQREKLVGMLRRGLCALTSGPGGGKSKFQREYDMRGNAGGRDATGAGGRSVCPF